MDSKQMALRIQDLLFANAGSDGDMCAQDIPLEDIEAVLSGAESPDLKRLLDEEAAARLANQS